MNTISAYQYARQTYTSHNVSLFAFQREKEKNIRNFPESRKAPHYHSQPLEERIKLQSGIVRYDGVINFLKEEKYVALIRREKIPGYTVINEIVDGLFNIKGGIDQITISADKGGYHAVIKRAESVINIKCDFKRDEVIAYHYGPKRNDPSIPSKKRKIAALTRNEPRPKKDGYHRGSTTEDIGVVAYAKDGQIMVDVLATRKKVGKHNIPKQKLTTIDDAENFIKDEFAQHFATEFPNSDERKKVKQSENIQFTLQFRGYRHSDHVYKSRDDVLRNAYQRAITKGIGDVFRNLQEIYNPIGVRIRTNEVTATKDELFKVFMNAHGTEQKKYIAFGPKDPGYKSAFRREQERELAEGSIKRIRKPHKKGKGISISSAIITPTLEGMQKAYETIISTKEIENTPEEKREEKEEVYNWTEEAKELEEYTRSLDK